MKDAEDYIDSPVSGDTVDSLAVGIEVTGTQWDTVLKWIENAGYDVTTDSTEWGNYYNNTAVAGNGRYSTLKSKSQTWQTGSFSKPENSVLTSVLYIGIGLYEDSKIKNIYDLAGNLWEWTAEYYSDYCIDRGGEAYYSGNVPVGYCSYQTSTFTSGGVGFRIVLYVM